MASVDKAAERRGLRLQAMEFHHISLIYLIGYWLAWDSSLSPLFEMNIDGLDLNMFKYV